MNAMVFAPTQLDNAVLWLCVKHPPQRRSGIARILGRDASTITQVMNRLRYNGYIDHGRGSCTPMPKALSYVSTLSEDAMRDLLRLRHIPVASEANHLTAAAGRAEEVAPPFGTGREPPGTQPMEPRGSIGCDTQAIIDALAAGQDPLLRAANAQLQARIAELEAENADLRKRLQTVRARVGFALHGL